MQRNDNSRNAVSKQINVLTKKTNKITQESWPGA